jgi:hypothetical protein
MWVSRNLYFVKVVTTEERGAIIGRSSYWKNSQSHFLFHQEIFDQNQRDCHPHPLYFSLFPQLKIKLKDRHFDITEVIDSESQAVLNTLTEYDFLDAFKKVEKALGTMHTSRRGLFRG